LTDQVDSVKIVVNDSGNAVTKYEYLPYGETWIESGDLSNNAKYNSQELDKETGYYFYNARHYDPEIARFVTADSVVDGEETTVGWNRYCYVKGNPIVYKDPSGHRILVDTYDKKSGKNKNIEISEYLKKNKGSELSRAISYLKNSERFKKIFNSLKNTDKLDVIIKFSTSSQFGDSMESKKSHEKVENLYWNKDQGYLLKSKAHELGHAYQYLNRKFNRFFQAETPAYPFSTKVGAMNDIESDNVSENENEIAKELNKKLFNNHIVEGLRINANDQKAEIEYNNVITPYDYDKIKINKIKKYEKTRVDTSEKRDKVLFKGDMYD
jgi:RHS repeat-associated protein